MKMSKETLKDIKCVIVILLANIFTGMLITMTNTTEAGLTQGVSSELITTLAVVYGGIYVLRFFLRVNEKELRNRIMNRFFINYNEREFKSNAADIQEITVGTIFDASKDLSLDKGAFLISAISTITTLIPAVSLIVKEWSYNKLAGVITLSSLVVSFLITYSCDKLFHWNTIAKEKKARLQSITVDNYMNAVTIKFMGFGNFCIDRLKRAQEESEPYFVNKRKFAYFRIIDVYNTAALLGAIYLCRDNLTMIALMIMVTDSVYYLAGCLSELVDLYANIKAQEHVIESIDGKDDEPCEVLDGAIEFYDLEFGYKETDGCSKSDVTFRFPYGKIESGKRYLFQGPSGAGKSTFIKLLARMLKASKGYYIKHENAKDITSNGYMRNFASNPPRLDVFYISQDITALNDTLWNNIVGCNEYDISEKEVYDLLCEVGLKDWFDQKISKGFETELGERGCHLSFGQMQRVNVIRAVLAMRYTPEKIFLIDEVTSNLDAESRDMVLKLFDRECHSTCIFIAHDEGYHEIVDEIYEVENHTFRKMESIQVSSVQSQKCV